MTNKLLKIEKKGCVPCKMVQNYLDEQGVVIEKVDIMENPEIGGKYSISSVPVTILLDSDNNEIQRSVGFNPLELEEMVAKLNQ